MRWTVLHQGALGDFIVSLPVYQGLHELYPDLKLDFWSHSAHLELVAGAPYWGAGHPCHGPELAPFLHDDLWRQAVLPALFQHAAVTLIFGQAASRPLASRLAARLARPVHWIHSFPPPSTPIPVSRYLVDQVRAAGFPISASCPLVTPRPEERAAVEEWLESQGCRGAPGFVAVHPGSGALGKVWPLQRWWHAIHWLQERHLPPLLILGPADEPLRSLALAALSRGVRVAEGLPLAQLAALLAAARFYLGNDSGVSHLAAAVGIPTIAIFGPRSNRAWHPTGPHCRVVESSWEAAAALPFDPAAPPGPLEPRVQSALEELLP
jgi:ADP-heptose:LPS heptosyltransferase